MTTFCSPDGLPPGSEINLVWLSRAKDNYPLYLVAIEQSAKNIFQSGKFQGIKQGAPMLPEPFAAAFFFQDRLEEREGQLLNLVNQKSQHHQQGKVDRKNRFTHANRHPLKGAVVGVACKP